MNLADIYQASRKYDERGMKSEDPQTANACHTAAVLLSLAYNILMFEQVRTSTSTWEIRAKRLRIAEALEQEQDLTPERVDELVEELNRLEHLEQEEAPDEIEDFLLERKAGVQL